MRIRAKKITKASLFKILFIGFSVSLFPFMYLCGIASLFGANTVRLNGQPVYGIKGLITALVLYVISCVIVVPLMWLGQILSFWIYSHFKKIEIEFVEGEVISPLPETATFEREQN